MLLSMLLLAAEMVKKKLYLGFNFQPNFNFSENTEKGVTKLGKF